MSSGVIRSHCSMAMVNLYHHTVVYLKQNAAPVEQIPCGFWIEKGVGSKIVKTLPYIVWGHHAIQVSIIDVELKVLFVFVKGHDLLLGHHIVLMKQSPHYFPLGFAAILFCRNFVKIHL